MWPQARSASLFRRVDGHNYYRFSMSPTGAAGGPYRRLVKNSAGAIQVLWQDTQSVVAGQTYALRIEAVGGGLRVLIDGVEVCAVRDSDHGTGGIALYSYRCNAAVFSGLVVTERGGTLAGWTLVEVGPLATSASWRREGGAISQTA